jgi:hypothetical protein
LIAEHWHKCFSRTTKYRALLTWYRWFR